MTQFIHSQKFLNETKMMFISLLKSLIAVVIGLGLGGFLAMLAGENPIEIMRMIITGAAGTSYDRGMVLYFASILIASGLAVAIPFQAGIFNIGAEGQILVGAMAVALFGIYGPADIPVVAAVPIAFCMAMLAAGCWGGIAGAIRAYRGGHEVIGSIMLNFIAAGLTGWLVVGKFQAADSQNPETSAVQEIYRLSHFDVFNGAPVSIAILVSIAAATCFWLALDKFRVGIRLKTVRQSPDAAFIAGFNVANVRFWSFFAGSAMCGIAGACMVLGDSGRFRMEISEGFGFLGIPVALLGKGRPMGVILSAFLFAGLHHGASALDLEATKVSRDLAQVIEALVVLCVVAQSFADPIIFGFKRLFSGNSKQAVMTEVGK